MMPFAAIGRNYTLIRMTTVELVTVAKKMHFGVFEMHCCAA